MARILVMDATYENCQAAVKRAFAAFPVDLQGKSVVVKVNALRASAPEEAICTHYRFLAAVLEEVRQARPAKLIVGDNVGTESYGCGLNVFKKTGLFNAAGPYFKNFSQDLVLQEITDPLPRKIAVNRDVLEADVYISVPKFKTHGLTILSGAVKNNYGLLPGAQKSWFHLHAGDPIRFARAIVAVFALRKPDLVIMDGIVAMEGNGPASPYTRWINKVLASDDAVAMDTVMARLVGTGVEDVPYLQICRERGLGETDLSRIAIEGDVTPIPDYQVPVLAESSYEYPSGVAGGRTSIKFFQNRVSLRPVIDAAKCGPQQPCSVCAGGCPGGALKMAGGLPRLDADLCLLCSRCAEVCPAQAVTLVAGQPF